MAIETVEYTKTVSDKNVHRVPQRAWRRWKSQGRTVFNSVYSAMKNNQYVFLHPKQEALSAQKWKTVAWNAAWVAADAAEGK